VILIEVGIKSGQVFSSQVDGEMESVEREILAKPVIQLRNEQDSVWITSSEVAFVRFVRL
jgi:hypothetical protein